MSKIYSSLAAALLLASPLLATAQLLYPTCSASWSWTSNSLGQSPCEVAAYLQGVCDNGVFSIPVLVPGDSYVGPTGSSDASDLCKCNTVVYSLMSACDACQDALWFSWNTWSFNCTSTDPITTFSNVVPNGTKVPGWAFLDVTKGGGYWNPTLSYQVGDNTELPAGESGAVSPLPTPTTTQTAVPGLSSSQAAFLSKNSGHNSKNKTAAIVGGVLSGIAFIVLSVALLLWRQRIKRRKTTRAAASIIFANRAVPLQEKVTRRNRDEPPLDLVQDAI
ncbi:hypothetical protein BJV77DRAFT_1003629 [Russula vinacea]|nr:hypothetical protein BJV77DRAFT_1003629 [Russula vinacea]